MMNEVKDITKNATYLKNIMDSIIYCVNFKNSKGLDELIRDASEHFKNLQFLAMYYDNSGEDYE